MTTPRAIAEIVEDLPSKFRGPGGAVAVLQDGALVGQKVWGYADLQSHVPMEADNVLPICSISKQMLCGLLTSLQQNPTPEMIARGVDSAKQLSDSVRELLQPNPLLADASLSMEHLCNNQSGIRDYWAMTVLWGAMPDGHFSITEHGSLMLERLGSFHFQPGTEYSYANSNYFIIARAIEKVTQRPLGELLVERILAPAGMKSATLCADTSKHPPPCVGYEGDENFGFYSAVNRIEWAGDAGIVASLKDMIAYEQFLDSSRDNPESWYYANSKQQNFKNNEPADYGYGLARRKIGSKLTIGHGGALRGYRLFRLYAPEMRMSVVTLLNQEHGDASEVCEYVLKQALSVDTDEAPVDGSIEAGSGWEGTYLDKESQLAVSVSLGTTPGYINLKYHRKPEKMRLQSAYRAGSNGTTVTLDGNVLHLHIPTDNRRFQAERVASVVPSAVATTSDLVGIYHCPEVDSKFDCSGSGSMLYGSFSGFLGRGPIHMMRPLAKDVWALACPRAMDSTPPGDWTIVVQRDKTGQVSKVTVGCWLARKLVFDRVE